MPSEMLQSQRKRQRRGSIDDSHHKDRSSRRQRKDTFNNNDDDEDEGGVVGESTIFRNISACSRCRLRKNRCDQRLPSCAGCAKVGVPCVGYDILTKREIPRSYLFYLENRVEQLEQILASHNISFPAATDLKGCALAGVAKTKSSETENYDDDEAFAIRKPEKPRHVQRSPAPVSTRQSRSQPLAYGESVTFMSKAFQTMQTHGVSAADDEYVRAQLKPLPERQLAFQLVMAYFDRVNPQFPILYREEFMKVFNRIYAKNSNDTSQRDFYFFYMVLALGAGHAFTPGEEIETARPGHDEDASGENAVGKSLKNPEDYYDRAALCFEQSISVDISSDDQNDNSLKALQAILLMANFALLRPISPGLWYLSGVAMRVAVDLGLYQESKSKSTKTGPDNNKNDAQTVDKTRELKRRLWWCTYSLDRLVSISLGRPFGISDNDITTPMPSINDKKLFENEPLFKFSNAHAKRNCDPISQHFIRLRMLQSEILTASQKARTTPTPSVEGFGSPGSDGSSALTPKGSDTQHLQVSSAWTQEMEKRLKDWQDLAPTKPSTGVSFPPAIFEFYYWQTIIVLYQSPLNTNILAEDIHDVENGLAMQRGSSKPLLEHEHEAYLKVAEAGQKVLRMYRHRHLTGCIQYTYSSTHYLFRVAMLYLHAIGKSSVVRREMSDDDMEFTVLVASSIFSDMQSTCPSAKGWLQTFERSSRKVARIKSLGAEEDKKSQQSMYKAPSHLSKNANETQEAVDQRLFPWESQGVASLADMDLSPPSQQQQQQPQMHGAPTVTRASRGRRDRRRARPNDIFMETATIWNFDDLVNEPLSMPQGMESSLPDLRDLQNWLMLPPDTPDVRAGAETRPNKQEM